MAIQPPTSKDEFVRPTRKKPVKAGRPSLISQEKVDTIVDLLRRGNYLSKAAAYVGLDPVTLRKWMNKGRELLATERDDFTEEEQLFVSFALEVEKAKAEAEIRAVEIIRGAMPNQWQAAAWYLERTNNADWGRSVRTEVTGEGGGPVQVDVEAVYRKLEAVSQRVIDAEVVEDTPSPETLAGIKAAIASAIQNATSEAETDQIGDEA